MTIEVKSVTESKLVSHSYPYIRNLQLFSKYKYSGFYELAQEIDNIIRSLLENQKLTYIRYPENDVCLLYVEEDVGIVSMYHTPKEIDEDYYKLARLTTYYPNKHTEKPSGIILEDGSYLQIEFTFAHHVKTLQMYVLFMSFHYGRCNEERKEFYFFRFDKESDYMFENGNIQSLDYKSTYHFHGNCDEPHFPLTPFEWQDKLSYIIDLLGKNLKRIAEKTGESIF